MLVLSRRPGEKLILETTDGPIEVVIRQIRNQQVRVGIVVPQSVRVFRHELVDARESG
jgi:carbon storage regulator CsrA